MCYYSSMTNIVNLDKVKAHKQIEETVIIANAIRGFLAEKRIYISHLTGLAAKDVSRGYWQRRDSGAIPYDTSDLAIIADVLDLTYSQLWKKLLPHLDSNQ